jgi:hypothetical protein
MWGESPDIVLLDLDRSTETVYQNQSSPVIPKAPVSRIDFTEPDILVIRHSSCHGVPRTE